MSVNLGINGLGKIGRLVLRAAIENSKPERYLYPCLLGDSQGYQ